MLRTRLRVLINVGSSGPGPGGDKKRLRLCRQASQRVRKASVSWSPNAKLSSLAFGLRVSKCFNSHGDRAGMSRNAELASHLDLRLVFACPGVGGWVGGVGGWVGGWGSAGGRDPHPEMEVESATVCAWRPWRQARFAIPTAIRRESSKRAREVVVGEDRYFVADDCLDGWWQNVALTQGFLEHDLPDNNVEHDVELVWGWSSEEEGPQS